MKIIYMRDLNGTEREVKFVTGMRSYRALLEKDGMGFSLHKTVIPRGTKHHWHYKHHLEACFCICGWGVLTNLRSGEQHMIREDMCYVLDEHDDHTFETLEDTVLISVFNPPCVGTETHGADGSYALPDKVAA